MKDTGPIKSALTWMTEQVEQPNKEKAQDSEAAMAAMFEQMVDRYKTEAWSEKK